RPPFKNVRKRHFRKVDRQIIQDRDEMEEENFSRDDYQSIDIKWEQDTDLFGGHLSQSDQEETSQKGLS
ncbi:unnamed protein product, partial [Rotaria sordida]